MEKPFEEEVIKEVLFSLAVNFAPGPDGFTMAFLQDCWKIVKADLKDLFREFHMNGKVSQGLNSTFISLIPKKVGANRIQDFRPISLFSQLIKIIAKVLSNGIHLVIHDAIDGNQYALLKEDKS